MPSYCAKMPILSMWYGLGQLMREGLVQPWTIDDLNIEMFTFYCGILDAEAKVHKEAMEKAQREAKKHARRH